MFGDDPDPTVKTTRVGFGGVFGRAREGFDKTPWRQRVLTGLEKREKRAVQLIWEGSTGTRKKRQYIQWFNNNRKVKVTRTVRVHFSIATYADYVGCDVLPMQACSLLLVDHANLIEILYTMIETISILLFIRHITLLPMTPDSILKDDINRGSKEWKSDCGKRIRATNGA